MDLKLVDAIIFNTGEADWFAKQLWGSWTYCTLKWIKSYPGGPTL